MILQVYGTKIENSEFFCKFEQVYSEFAKFCFAYKLYQALREDKTKELPHGNKSGDRKWRSSNS